MTPPPTIHFAEVDEAELRSCAVGDILKLWTRPGYDWIHVYRPGTVGGRGKVGILAKTDNPAIGQTLAQGLSVWFKVQSVEGLIVTLTTHTQADEALDAGLPGEAARLKKELLRPPRAPVAMSMEVRAAENHPFKIGQRLKVDLTSVDDYVRAPTMDVALVSSEGVAARGILPTLARTVLLRAHFTGVDLHILVIAVAKDPAYAGERSRIWKEAAATARVVFGNPAS
ncbi:MAG TPA: hypothetical protein VGI11_00390 [Variovorax sp.]